MPLGNLLEKIYNLIFITPIHNPFPVRVSKRKLKN